VLDPIVIRAAHPAEAAYLTALAARSKAAWGYDAQFIAAAAPELDISPGLIASSASFVAMKR
jgi:hypothetical protein